MALSRLIERNYPLDWACLSNNPSITSDIVLAHLDKPWDWEWLSGNPSITFGLVLACPDKSWE